MAQKDNLQLYGDYFVLHLSGAALPPDQILENMKKVVNLCKVNNIKKGIIYRSEKVKQVASVFDFYKFSKYLASQKLHGFKFALVFPKEETEDKIDFLETASVNRGVNFQRFDSYEDAEKWITG
jgi:hypothetical protein